MNIEVLGHGYMGSRHAANLKKIGHNVYVSDVKENDFKNPPQPEKFDAVVIATPTTDHLDCIEYCFDKELPFFLEKPIAHRDSRLLHQPEFYELCKMVGYNLRFHGMVRTAKGWLEAGYIGAPLWGRFVCGEYKEPIPDGNDVTLNWSHEIDLALYLLGPAKIKTSAIMERDGIDIITDIVLLHKSGCQSTIHLDYITRPPVRRSMIAGLNGLIQFDLNDRTGKVERHDGEVIASHKGFDTQEMNYLDEIGSFIRRVGGRTTLGCTATEGLATLALCLEVRKRAKRQ